MENSSKNPSRPKRFVRGLLFTVAVLLTLAALLLAEENWRGSHAWSQYRRQLEAKGEHFDIDSVIPKQVPDDQNLAMIPYFVKLEKINLPDKVSFPHRPLWTMDLASDLTIWAQAYGSPTSDPITAASTVLAKLDAGEPLLTELKSGNRPYCRFNFDYQHWVNDTNVQSSTLEQLAQAKGFLRVLTLHAQAELVSGQTAQALSDIELGLRLDKGLLEAPLLISQLVGYAGLAVMLQSAGEGLAEHRWSDAELSTLQNELRQIDLLATTAHALRGERNICCNPYFSGSPFKPRGWDRLEELNCDRLLEDSILPCFETTGRDGVLRAWESHEGELERASAESRFELFVVHHNFFASRQVAYYSKVIIKTAEAQTGLNEVCAACALERYRLAEKHYPGTLDELTPRFAPALPKDIINGQSLKYRRLDSGKFILYSVGWNGTDEGGKIAIAKDGHRDNMSGDWVFEYPD
jgi:hypothetical protein